MARVCERCGGRMDKDGRFCSERCAELALEALRTEMENQDIDGYGGGY